MKTRHSSLVTSGSKGTVLAIVGPTGVGKSDVALELARRLGGEIVSADSMQVYQGMDTGTAKPAAGDRRAVPHHLLDIMPLDHAFSVAEYQTLARCQVAEIQARDRLPILVGGSGLYVRAVIDNLTFPPHDGATGGVRDTLRRQAERRGESHLVGALAKLDPQAARRIDPKNVRRIVRALEVRELTGRPLSEHQAHWSERVSIYENLAMVGIKLPRFLLYQRLDERVDRMLGDGLLGEVRALVEAGYRHALTARQAIGYKELLAFLEGRVSYDQAVERIKRNTRHLAKRQLTWFRADPRVRWFERGAEESARTLANRVESYLKGRGRGA